MHLDRFSGCLFLMMRVGRLDGGSDPSFVGSQSSPFSLLSSSNSRVAAFLPHVHLLVFSASQTILRVHFLVLTLKLCVLPFPCFTSNTSPALTASISERPALIAEGALFGVCKLSLVCLLCVWPLSCSFATASHFAHPRDSETWESSLGHTGLGRPSVRGVCVIHPLSLTGVRTLCRLAQGMGWLLPSYLPSTSVLVSASALKVVLFTICGKRESGLIMRWMVTVGVGQSFLFSPMPHTCFPQGTLRSPGKSTTQAATAPLKPSRPFILFLGVALLCSSSRCMRS